MQTKVSVGIKLDLFILQIMPDRRQKNDDIPFALINMG